MSDEHHEAYVDDTGRYIACLCSNCQAAYTHKRVTPTQAAQRYRAALMARLDVLADASGSASKPFFEWTVKRLTDIPTSALAELIGALEHIERAFIFPDDQWDAATRQERE